MKDLTKFLAVLVTILLVSCGDEKKEQETITIGEEGSLERVETSDNVEATGSNNQSGEAVQRSEEGVVQVNLTGDDMMKFNLNEIRVKAGETVRLTLKHVGQLPENAMGHNFVLLQQGTDVANFAQQAATASGNDYIPEGTNEVIVHTEMIGGGEETSIEFTAPEAGTYDFICSFPGHYVQMRGKFIVE
ncbi:azurin [Salinimicrobium xinjiangense]|uniref:azurin n=1 Tax=Salinimicrobium xinjiangense TaxID=438596 RepID=UPI000422761C|nr:azurin [Salinimicrobium xinjiangense]